MRRGLIAWCLCGASLCTGILAAAIAAENRQRGDELDRLERWCEAQSRRNELVRVENRRREWALLGQRGCEAGARDGSAAP